MCHFTLIFGGIKMCFESRIEFGLVSKYLFYQLKIVYILPFLNSNSIFPTHSLWFPVLEIKFNFKLKFEVGKFKLLAL